MTLIEYLLSLLIITALVGLVGSMITTTIGVAMLNRRDGLPWRFGQWWRQ